MSSTKAQLKRLQPSTIKSKPIKTFDDFITHPLYGSTNLTAGQLERLMPYRKKWENKTFTFAGNGSDLYSIQDIIF